MWLPGRHGTPNRTPSGVVPSGTTGRTIRSTTHPGGFVSSADPRITHPGGFTRGAAFAHLVRRGPGKERGCTQCPSRWSHAPSRKCSRPLPAVSHQFAKQVTNSTAGCSRRTDRLGLKGRSPLLRGQPPFRHSVDVVSNGYRTIVARRVRVSPRLVSL
jgi:hypothetical protein